jgi:hypothetical protein
MNILIILGGYDAAEAIPRRRYFEDSPPNNFTSSPLSVIITG